nr:unnamed protein product [Digitaria exilis]
MAKAPRQRRGGSADGATTRPIFAGRKGKPREDRDREKAPAKTWRVAPLQSCSPSLSAGGPAGEGDSGRGKNRTIGEVTTLNQILAFATRPRRIVVHGASYGKHEHLAFAVSPHAHTEEAKGNFGGHHSAAGHPLLVNEGDAAGEWRPRSERRR